MSKLDTDQMHYLVGLDTYRRIGCIRSRAIPILNIISWITVVVIYTLGIVGVMTGKSIRTIINATPTVLTPSPTSMYIWFFIYGLQSIWILIQVPGIIFGWDNILSYERINILYTVQTLLVVGWTILWTYGTYITIPIATLLVGLAWVISIITYILSMVDYSLRGRTRTITPEPHPNGMQLCWSTLPTYHRSEIDRSYVINTTIDKIRIILMGEHDDVQYGSTRNIYVWEYWITQSMLSASLSWLSYMTIYCIGVSVSINGREGPSYLSWGCTWMASLYTISILLLLYNRDVVYASVYLYLCGSIYTRSTDSGVRGFLLAMMLTISIAIIVAIVEMIVTFIIHPPQYIRLLLYSTAPVVHTTTPIVPIPHPASVHTTHIDTPIPHPASVPMTHIDTPIPHPASVPMVPVQLHMTHPASVPMAPVQLPKDVYETYTDTCRYNDHIPPPSEVMV